jgi:uncharacterized protein
MHPTLPSERIEVIDILRGFAIFGILLVNMAFYNSPVYLSVTDTKLWEGTVDLAAQWLIRFVAEGKFYSLFSFLFGLGLALQMARSESSGIRFLPLYVRRLLVLLIIGGIHATGLWAGDILVPYALLGFVLLAFRNRKPKTIIIWAIVSLLIPVLVMGLGFAALELGRSIPQAAEQIKTQFAHQAKEYEALVYQSLRVYSTGTFAEVMNQRLQDLGFAYFGLLFYGPNIFALFLLGLYIGKRGIFQDIVANLPLVRKAMWWGLALGIIGNLLFATIRAYANPSEPTLPAFLFTAALAVGAPALCFFYVATIVRLYQRQTWRKWLEPLAAVGRTAVSNYLFQSVVCSGIFLSYGFGLYGEIGPAAGLALTILIFVMQLAISQWWAKRFRFGPVEWLWRSLTYGRVQPMRLT